MALGLCKQSELDLAVQKASKSSTAMSDDERRKLVSTEQSLSMDAEPKMPSAIEGLETFSLSEEPKEEKEEVLDADSFFNLPSGDDAEDDDK